jgi:putative ABC transport system permease protein
VIQNYFKIAWRKLLRQKAFTAINIVGLSVSLCGALLIYMYVSHELSYDRFNEKAGRIYRMYCAYADPGEAVRRFPNTPPVLIPALKQELGEFEAAIRLQGISDFKTVIMKYEDKTFSETGVFQTDSGFFAIFTARFLAGNPATALTRPNSVVLSRSTAAKYFGDATSALGKSIEVAAYVEQTCLVTGVTEDLPANAHFRYNVLMSHDYAAEKYHPDNWLSHSPAAYLLVAENANIPAMETRIRVMTEKVLNPVYVERFGKTYDAHKEAGGLQEYRLQPLTDIHLYSADMQEPGQGNIVYVYLFVGIGIMLVSIASFNYINLSTAQSAREAKAAGVRKLLGARTSQLYKLFITQSMGVVMIAALIAIALTQVLLALDHSFLSRFIPYHAPSIEACFLLIALALVVGLISGLVPAGIVTAFQPVKVLKGQLVQGKKGSRLRQVLVVTQFAVSMGLIICTFLIGNQLAYMQTMSLGFDKEHLMVIRNVDKLGDRGLTLKQALSNETFVTRASLSYNTLGSPHNYAAYTPVELIEQGKREAIGIPVFIGDEDYLETLGVRLVMGHPFPPGLASEHQQIILNKEALRAVGWQNRTEEELIGQTIDVNGLKYELAGIAEDYHFTSLRQKIGPMAIFSHYYQEYDALMLRIAPGTYQQAILRMQEHWKALAPEVPFDYSFVDQDLDGLYQAEQNLAALSGSFSGLAIFVACLGLLGLAMFSAERRVKEIGIRKVLGATVHSIVVLLSQDIVRLIALAFLIATPLAWYLMDRWLENFAYQIDISVFTFLAAGGLTFVIAIGTIGFQTIRAALANPAESIRYE